MAEPFVREFVFRSLRTVDGATPHETGDFLILHRGSGILVEQKCQDDPTRRTTAKAELWARKKAKEGWRQMRRALARPKDRPVWCDHERRGRVEFPDGLPIVRHGIVAVEVFQEVDLEPDAEKLPLEYAGIPITYLSVNDFLNLAANLRTIPELAEYLAARRSLSHADLRLIGDEKTLFHFYLLSGGSFAGCVGRADARIAIASQQDRVREVLEWKAEADRHSFLLEYVADKFAAHHPRFTVALPQGIKKGTYDPAKLEHDTLEIQEELADLRLRERSELGRAFDGAIRGLSDEKEGFKYMAARLDSKPELVYVFGASKNVDSKEVQLRIMTLVRGAMAYYEKRRCLLLLDRDGRSVIASLSRPEITPTLADFDVGQRLFGHLRVTSTPMELAPEHHV
ncbi:MAG TPA: hypothetical protein VG028_05130 [Terriglobia bacterium]|nr:hypothetical protein [Terriglobia bacterium]